MKEKATQLRLPTRKLVDAYARARVTKKAAEKEEERLRAQVLERLEATGVDHLIGRAFEVERTVAVRETLDTKIVRALLSPKQIEKATVKTPVTTLSCKERSEVVVPLGVVVAA